ncbi:hypothetical protein CHLNCDRAFT_25123 [Chlorella variabilis]|uniref:RNA polymerase II transcription factor B subunit 2 n=1 Tax=Chlorella variabilis TaxID=554065 RepID=E1ZJ66_CHLVA|nr:hypothetical protein CHLNCDRAFT_25123 [Chlorella variabilis]EFN54287.1 hypothetical protein CHLNCDRAFT_25123 [Chlorella variabilis]|eukprot:XP_005846389.1 hypothetical protein CHLNCDRAFT_25123 [Chlorella variabilis]
MVEGLVSFITTSVRGEQLERLFVQPYAVVAILRSLPPLARHMLLRLASTAGTVPAGKRTLADSWATSDGSSKLSAALCELAELGLLAKEPHDGQVTYTVNAGFQAQLRRTMCSGCACPLPGHPAAPVPSAAELDAYARRQWEALLLYLVNGNGTPPMAPPVLHATPIDIPSLLAAAGLMVKDECTLEQKITEHGFQFLLANLYSQLWSAVRQYLTLLNTAGGADLAVAINFLLRLGLQGAAAAMAHSQLDSAERTIAAHMCQLGLLMPVPGANELWLHPTRLAAVLAGGGRAGEAAVAPEEGYVIVESNFRVYAYTTSAVQVAVLRVFVRCDALLPNLFVGTITRESATNALDTGIAADQVVAFLRQHAHPRAAAKTPTVVTDQIRLWAQELKRLQEKNATLYDKFESKELYVGAVAHARQLNALLYSCEDRRQLVVESAFHGLMVGHLKERKQALGL